MNPPANRSHKRFLLRALSCLLLGFLACLLAACQSTPKLSEAQRPVRYTDEPYRAVLAASVRDGLVDYAAIDDRLSTELDRYLYAVARFGPSTVPEQFPTEHDRLAYYVNAYNAFMIRKWLDSGARSADPGTKVNWLVWFTTDQWAIDGGYLSMDALEQRLIRPRFKEPRIHFALICGSLSCPPLLEEPYVGDRIIDQMDGIARRWLEAPDGLLVKDDGSIEISAIFKWYRGDFEPLSGLRGVLEKYLSDHDPRKAQSLRAFDAGKLSFMGYDWSINKAF